MGLGAVNIDTKGIGKIFGSVGDMAIKIREALTGKKITDPAVMAEIAAELKELEFSARNGQMEINKAEAQSGNMFVAGWRPFCGWVCVCGLVWGVFVHPIWTWVSQLSGLTTPPEVQTAALITILVGMLGLGGLRTYEKKEDIQDKH